LRWILVAGDARDRCPHRSAQLLGLRQQTEQALVIALIEAWAQSFMLMVAIGFHAHRQ
jgi:hypothetical protein